ncbi:MAG TPA: DUF1972 domain-containing protein [Chitinophagaceae bacterium]|nr:DUF1972 domain-containing protein [Chitinophagaceae bacterium]
MKIGILGTRGIPNAYGGFEQFAQYLAQGLVKKGHEVYVYNSSNHPYQEKEWEDIYLIHCKDLEDKIGTAGQFIYDYNCLRDSRKRGFDILLQLGYTSNSIWYWLWPGAPTVNVVNMDGLEWKRSKYSKLTRRFLQWAEKKAARHAAVLVADSPGIQDYLLKKYRKSSIYIPYGAEIPAGNSDAVLSKWAVASGQYFLLIARMEPENNIEMIIQGYLASGKPYPLLVVGNTKNAFGKYLLKKYPHEKIRFTGAIYDQPAVNNLRYYSARYFHGHSVGGTNPSLLEAMGCQCNIAAHDNVFNRAVLTDCADYFSNWEDITRIIDELPDFSTVSQRKERNLEKIKRLYNWETIINEYENVFLNAGVPSATH